MGKAVDNHLSLRRGNGRRHNCASPFSCGCSRVIPYLVEVERICQEHKAAVILRGLCQQQRV